MAVIQEVNVLKKKFFSFKVTVFNPENNYSHPLCQRTIFLYFARTLETIHCVYTMYFADISTSDVMLFQKSSYSLTL